MLYITNITISTVLDKVYMVVVPAGVSVYYSNIKIINNGGTGYFVSNGSNNLILETTTAGTGNVVVTELLRSLYNINDGQGGTIAFQPMIDKWITQYSFRPEWMTMVGNRLVTFKGGKPFIHNGPYNTFFGQRCDTCVALVHSEAGNTVKSYKTIAIEGDTPDRVHVRTEVPYVQSTDILGSEFTIKEGVNYSELYRDRLSPNAPGNYNDKLFTGDTIRGELCKAMVVYTQPQVLKSIKFVDIDFDSSTGQTV